MIDKLQKLDQLAAMIDDENLKEEIIDIFFEIFIYYADREKLKGEILNHTSSLKSTQSGACPK